mmetsp:Transcript_11629/g.26879  ORF Transcript_11629/g.26879 Transcript_11629/m.26879 type:complete len:313 (-) Transcript_11629:243-1181(-)
MVALDGLSEIGTALTLAIAVTVVMQLTCFLIAFVCKFDKITDLAGCANFIVLAIGTLFLGPRPFDYRAVVLTSLVCASRLQLGAYLLYRVLKRGRDSRFDEVRSKFFVFLAFWVFQILWVYVTSLAVMYVNAAGGDAERELTAADISGWIIFVLGFTLQVVSDMTKQSFRSDPANAKRVCDVGPWRYSRHPNFCGEVLMWWGVYIAGIPVFIRSPSGWATICSPLFTMYILTCFSGIPTSEGQASKRWYDGGEAQQRFEAYFDSTPPLWLFPPSLYRRFPLCLKRVLCFDLPMYEYKSEVSEPLDQQSRDAA